jgi:hypothetical protein
MRKENIIQFLKPSDEKETFIKGFVKSEQK